MKQKTSITSQDRNFRAQKLKMETSPQAWSILQASPSGQDKTTRKQTQSSGFPPLV